MLSPSSSKTTYLFFFVLIALYLLSVFINWGVLPLDGEEPRRALVSVEMLQSGNYISPTVFGWTYLNKPPVYNWVMSFLMFLFGTREEWVVRLPSLIFLLLWAFFHYEFSKKFFPKNIAIISALFLLTDFDLFFYALGSGGEIDVFYSFIVYLQIMLLFYFNQQQKWLQLFLWSYIFCAIGFLTKGFPSLVFQGFTLIALCVFNRSVKVLFRWQHLVGLLAFCGLVGAYLFALSFYTSPKWLVINLLNESLLKSAVGEKSERLWRKVFVYPFSFLKLLLPWSLLLLLLLKKHSYKLFNHPLVKFSILFILFNLWLYAFTGRPILRYVYVFIPFSYHIIAFIFWKTTEEYPAFINKIFKYAGTVFGVIAVILIGLPFFVEVPLLWVVLSGLTLLFFIVFFKKTLINKVWAFCLGIVLLRLVYATLFIPIQERYIKINYRNVAADIIRNSKGQEITLWTKPQPFSVGIDVDYLKWKFDSVIIPPRFKNYMLPYYIYYQNGHIVKYDTAISANKFYLSTENRLAGENISAAWSWYDVRQELKFVLFRSKENGLTN